MHSTHTRNQTAVDRICEIEMHNIGYWIETHNTLSLFFLFADEKKRESKVIKRYLWAENKISR